MQGFCGWVARGRVGQGWRNRPARSRTAPPLPLRCGTVPPTSPVAQCGARCAVPALRVPVGTRGGHSWACAARLRVGVGWVLRAVGLHPAPLAKRAGSPAPSYVQAGHGCRAGTPLRTYTRTQHGHAGRTGFISEQLCSCRHWAMYARGARGYMYGLCVAGAWPALVACGVAEVYRPEHPKILGKREIGGGSLLERQPPLLPQHNEPHALSCIGSA